MYYNNLEAFRKIHPDLPIFRLKHKEAGILYVPNKFAVTDLDDADLLEKNWLNSEKLLKESTVNYASDWLLNNARKASEKWINWSNSPYEPECLTIYLSNYCNLNCQYCFSSYNGRIRKKGVKFHIQKNIAKSLGCLSLLTKTRDVKFPCNNT